MFKIALCSIAKDEENYLKEWCEYHSKMGFDDIFVYQNNWRYVRNDITDSKVHFEIIDGNQAQNRCYNEFIFNNYRKYDFIFFIDIDEFFVLNSHDNLQSYLESIKSIPNVYVNWRIFGDNNQKEVIDGNYSQLNRFTMCDDKLHRLGKNIINTRLVGDKIIFNNPHILVYNTQNISVPQYYDSNGDKINNYPPWDRVENHSQNAELFHYRNKTYSERLNKHGPNNSDAYWKVSPYKSLDAFNSSFEEYNINKITNTKARDFLYGKDN